VKIRSLKEFHFLSPRNYLSSKNSFECGMGIAGVFILFRIPHLNQAVSALLA
jgi:hypothetical protein